MSAGRVSFTRSGIALIYLEASSALYYCIHILLCRVLYHQEDSMKVEARSLGGNLQLTT